MAKTSNTTPSRFHNMSAAQLADEIGRVDAIVKAAEAELKALKDEFKARGLTEAAGARQRKTCSGRQAGIVPKSANTRGGPARIA